MLCYDIVEISDVRDDTWSSLIDARQIVNNIKFILSIKTTTRHTACPPNDTKLYAHSRDGE